jgi:class 3 adenylate cyclase
MRQRGMNVKNLRDQISDASKGHSKSSEHSQFELERRMFHLKTLYDLSQEIGVLKGTKEIMKNLLMMIIGTFGALRGIVILVDVKKGSLEEIFQRGMGKTSLGILSRAIESGYFRNLEEISCIHVLDEEGGSQINKGGNIVDLLNSCKMNICIPFKVNEDLRGGIGLGNKLLGDSYTMDDQELLCTLSVQGAVAIENSRLVERMKKEEVVRTNLSRYLSPQAVEQVIKRDIELKLGGDRKIVSILFSDIRNFTQITETCRPDQLIQILNEYFTAMAKIIFEHRGSLDKYIGDAIVAVFGSLIHLENSARSAAQTAIQMMRYMPKLNEKWMNRYGFHMDIGIGINTGEVFLGNIGSPERMEFAVIGDPVNVAARLSGLAHPRQILITKETSGYLGAGIRHSELPPAKVKGKAKKLEIYEVQYE